MHISPPQIDQRKFDDIFKEFKEIAKSIKDQWDIKGKDDNDFGIALSKVFISILQQVIIRLNKVPNRNFLEFLNFLGFELSSSIPAKVPVTFQIIKDAKEDVVIPKGTKLLAEANEKHRELTFETEDTILVTRSKLSKVYSVIPKIDKIYDHMSKINNKEPFYFFYDLDRSNIQEHVIYFGHNDLFNISQEINENQKKTFQIYLTFKTYPEYESDLLVDLFSNKNYDYVQWSCNWFEEGKEVIFNVKPDNSQKNTIILEPSPDTTTFEIEKRKLIANDDNTESFWIRCILLERNSYLIKYRKIPSIANINIKIKMGDSNTTNFLLPDLIYFNNIPLKINPDSNEIIYPFGKLPFTYDTFYISNKNAFSKKGYEIKLYFDDINPDFEGKVDNQEDLNLTPILSWEYWNGKTWMPLDISHEKSWDIVDNEEPHIKYISIFTFICPNNIEEVEVNGNKNFWIRVRIASGDYGKGKLKKEGDDIWIWDYEPVKAPIFRNLKIKLNSEGTDNRNKNTIVKTPLVITFNNLQFLKYDLTTDIEKLKPFLPFVFFNNKNNHPAIYFGINSENKMIGGPISIYFSMIENLSPLFIDGNLNFYYYSSTGWKKLDSIDYTAYLTKKGYIKFHFPKDFEKSLQFGEELYWIKIEDDLDIFSRETSNDILFADIKNKLPYLYGLYLNTVSCSNTSYITNEIPIKNRDNSYSLSQTPLPSLDGSNEEIWINEGKSSKENELELYNKENVHKVKEILDIEGNVIERWVLWQKRADLLASTNEDRHYLLDYLTGTIRFGNGNNGKSLPLIENNIQVNYTYGGGKEGNIDPKEIKTLKTNIPLIDFVTNYDRAEGGSDQQTVTNAMDEWPNIFKNREQAVTYQDFESLIRNKFSYITRVKCLPTTNINGVFQKGHVTIVIAPIKSYDEIKAIPTRGLLEKVKEYIFQRSSNVLVSFNQINIIKPLYFKVSVFAKIYVNDMNSISTIQRIYFQKLKSFLDPLQGGYNKTGWDFGKFPCDADICDILSEIKEIDHITNLKIITECDEPSELLVYYEKLKSANFDKHNVLIDQDKIPPHSLIYSGDHEMEIEIFKEKEKN